MEKVYNEMKAASKVGFIKGDAKIYINKVFKDVASRLTPDKEEISPDFGMMMIPCKFSDSEEYKLEKVYDSMICLTPQNIGNLDDPESAMEEMSSCLLLGEIPPEELMLNFIQEYADHYPSLQRINATLRNVLQRNELVVQSGIQALNYNMTQMGVGMHQHLFDFKTEVFDKIKGLEDELNALRNENPKPQYTLESSVVESESLVPSLVHQNQNLTIKEKEVTNKISSSNNLESIEGKEYKVSVKGKKINTKVLTKRTVLEKSMIDVTLDNKSVDSGINMQENEVKYKKTYSDVLKSGSESDSKEENFVDINDEVKNQMELLTEGCVLPKRIEKYCQIANYQDVHISYFNILPSHLSRHSGNLYSAFYLNGCANPVPVYLVFKDDRDLPVYQNSIGASIDVICSRSVANMFGIKNVYTELLAIPFLKRVDEFKPGFYTERLGSIQRRKYGLPKGLFNVIERATKMIIDGHKILDVVCFVHEYLKKIFVSNQFKSEYVVTPLPSIDEIYGTGPSNQEIRILPPYLREKGLELPRGCVDRLPRCIEGCLAKRNVRHGMMYGSHVQYHFESGKYYTPCGVEIKQMSDYWIHPCTVRARTMCLKNSIEVRKGLLTRVIEKEFCLVCGRGYQKRSDANLCEIFCSVIQTAINSEEEDDITFIKMLEVGPFGERINPYSIEEVIVSKENKVKSRMCLT